MIGAFLITSLNRQVALLAPTDVPGLFKGVLDVAKQYSDVPVRAMKGIKIATFRKDYSSNPPLVCVFPPALHFIRPYLLSSRFPHSLHRKGKGIALTGFQAYTLAQCLRCFSPQKTLSREPHQNSTPRTPFKPSPPLEFTHPSRHSVSLYAHVGNG